MTFSPFFSFPSCSHSLGSESQPSVFRGLSFPYPVSLAWHFQNKHSIAKIKIRWSMAFRWVQWHKALAHGALIPLLHSYFPLLPKLNTSSILMAWGLICIFHKSSLTGHTRVTLSSSLCQRLFFLTNHVCVVPAPLVWLWEKLPETKFFSLTQWRITDQRAY